MQETILRENFLFYKYFRKNVGPYQNYRFVVCLFVINSFETSHYILISASVFLYFLRLGKIAKTKIYISSLLLKLLPIFSVIPRHFGEYFRCRNLFTTSEKISGIVWSCNHCGFCVSKKLNHDCSTPWLCTVIKKKNNIKQIMLVMYKMFWTVQQDKEFLRAYNPVLYLWISLSVSWLHGLVNTIGALGTPLKMSKFIAQRPNSWT